MTPAPFPFPLGFPSGKATAKIRTIRLACDRKVSLSADRAYLLPERSIFTGQGRFQLWLRRQHRRPEITAERAGPPFIQHVAGTVQGEAELILAVIVGAQVRYQPADRRSLGSCQFPCIIE